MLRKLSYEHMRKCIAPKISRAASRTGIDRVRRRTSFGKERRRRVSRRAGGTIRLIAEFELQLMVVKNCLSKLDSAKARAACRTFSFPVGWENDHAADFAQEGETSL